MSLITAMHSYSIVPKHSDDQNLPHSSSIFTSSREQKCGQWQM